MTEEQIKQNAEVYAKERCIRYNEQYGACYDAYIAGAHSRDEEIYDLKRDIEDLQKMVKMRSDVFECTRKEIGRLNSQWISVKDRLPEESKKYNGGLSDTVFVVTNKDDGTSARYDHATKTWCPAKILQGSITHWMPIPQIEKGE